MNTKLLFTTLVLVLLFAVSCEKEALLTDDKTNDELLALVEDEVLAELNFMELLEEGDDGIFWGDDAFSLLKSGDKSKSPCATREVENKNNKKVVTLDYTESDCGKSGIIIIVYLRAEDKTKEGKKTITYIDFTNKNGTVFNGKKTILRKNASYIVESDLTIDKINKEEKPVTFIRKSRRQITWICRVKGETGGIKKVTGNTQITRIKEDGEKSYTKKIVRPLLIVKACVLKVQAGVVKITKDDDSEVVINYGKMPEAIDCDSGFDCESTFKVTKDGETIVVTLVDGKRIKRKKNDK